MRNRMLTALVLSTLTFPALAAEQAGGPTRAQVLKEAARYAEHRWTSTDKNIVGSCTQQGYKSDYQPGAHVGVPYAWGGFMSIETFDARIKQGLGAGSHSKHGVLSCVAGIDCSGYVSRLWGLTSKYGTSTLSTVCKEIKLEEIRPGDAFNKAGSHVVLWVGRTDEGNPIIYEASGSASKVRLATPGWKYLSGYVPIRYNKIREDAGAAVAVETSAKAQSMGGGSSASAQTGAGTKNTGSPSATQTSSTASAQPSSTASTQASASGSSATIGAGQPSTASTTSAATPATPAGQASVQPLAEPALTGAPTPGDQEVVLRFGQDVGFEPAAEDALAVGPDFLTAQADGTAALYDQVRNKVLLLGRDGSRQSFDAGHADGLAFVPGNDLAVLDGDRGEVRFYSATGALKSTVPFPKEVPIGPALTLEAGRIYATDAAGNRKLILEASSGRLMPALPTPPGNDQPSVLRDAMGAAIVVGNERLMLPFTGSISVRFIGPWLEIQVARDGGARGLEVSRVARRENQLVTLPAAGVDGYIPFADVAAAGSSSLIYLQPQQGSVKVVWVDAK